MGEGFDREELGRFAIVVRVTVSIRTFKDQ